MLAEIMMLDSGETLVRAAGKAGISEVYSPPRIAPYGPLTKDGKLGPGWSLDLTTVDPEGRPWDFDRADCRQRAKQLVRETQPVLLVGSPMCTWFSSLMGFNRARMDPETYRYNMDRAVSHLKFVFDLYAIQIEKGRYFAHEHPPGCIKLG